MPFNRNDYTELTFNIANKMPIQQIIVSPIEEERSSLSISLSGYETIFVPKGEYGFQVIANNIQNLYNAFTERYILTESKETKTIVASEFSKLVVTPQFKKACKASVNSTL